MASASSIYVTREAIVRHGPRHPSHGGNSIGALQFAGRQPNERRVDAVADPDKFFKTLGSSAEPHPSLRPREPHPARVVLELLFHPDMRRIGGVHAAGFSSIDQEIEVGRDVEFATMRGGSLVSPLPLGDPQISRRQVSLHWSADSKRFRAVDLSGRGGCRILDTRGQTIEQKESAFSAGSLLVIRDRIILLCTVRPIELRSDDALIGQSEIMADLRIRIQRMADMTDTVLVRGEPGTGKELVARALHEMSNRKDSMSP